MFENMLQTSPRTSDVTPTLTTENSSTSFYLRKPVSPAVVSSDNLDICQQSPSAPQLGRKYSASSTTSSIYQAVPQYTTNSYPNRPEPYLEGRYSYPGYCQPVTTRSQYNILLPSLKTSTSKNVENTLINRLNQKSLDYMTHNSPVGKIQVIRTTEMGSPQYTNNNCANMIQLNMPGCATSYSEPCIVETIQGNQQPINGVVLLNSSCDCTRTSIPSLIHRTESTSSINSAVDLRPAYIESSRASSVSSILSDNSNSLRMSVTAKSDATTSMTAEEETADQLKGNVSFAPEQSGASVGVEPLPLMETKITLSSSIRKDHPTNRDLFKQPRQIIKNEPNVPASKIGSHDMQPAIPEGTISLKSSTSGLSQDCCISLLLESNTKPVVTSTPTLADSQSAANRKKRKYQKKNVKSKKYTIMAICNDDDIDSRRKYFCKVCSKGFTTSGHLARHNRIHTGEKRHVCPYEGCNQRFNRHDNCLQHYRTHLRRVKEYVV